MARHSCEKCGADASVTLYSARPYRAGDPAPTPSPERHLCRDCATAAGVPLRAHPPVPMAEPEPPSWADIREHLTMYELVLRERPEAAAYIREFLAMIPRFTQHISEPMPPDVAAQIARFELPP